MMWVFQQCQFNCVIFDAIEIHYIYTLSLYDDYISFIDKYSKIKVKIKLCVCKH